MRQQTRGDRRHIWEESKNRGGILVRNGGDGREDEDATDNTDTGEMFENDDKRDHKLIVEEDGGPIRIIDTDEV